VLEAGDPDGGEAAPIGTPLPGVYALALDPRGRPVAPGEVGELYLGGPTLARGYLGRPDLTTEKFVPNPFADQRPTTNDQRPTISAEKADEGRKTEDEAGAGESLSGAQEHSDVVPTLYRSNALPLQRSNARLYRTGDLVRRRGDGQLVFAGRADDEFKISGHRIDPGEVEARLLGHPRVREAAVVGQELPGGVRRLAAFVVAEQPAPSAAELRRHLLAGLPAAVVPSSVSFCAHLPRSSSGKLDRAALKTALSDQTAPEAAATELERAVLEVWGQVLGRAGLAAQDDFFELGGQSLQTLQVSSRLGAALGREVPVALLFRHPTAAALAQALERQAGADAAPDRAALPPELLADAELPAEVAPERARRPGPLRRALLTGATGFVGTYLLHELLTQTGAQIDCLVRAASPEEGLARIESALAAQGLPAAGLAGRVRALPADLARPRLGLGAAQFDELAASCDAIYHSAALVSVLRSYQSLRAVNVCATLDLLRLAAARCVPLHHISTLAVAPPAALSAEVREAFVEAHPGLRDGYQQSKWAAERLLEQASARGLPVAVYRLGRVVGAPGGGAANPQDLLWQILRAGVAAGVLPELDLDEIWTPADYVARAVVRLSLSAPAGVFNLAPEAPVPLRALAGWVREYGYPVATCRPAEWPARLAHSGHATVLSALEAFAHSAEAPASQLPPGLGRIHAGRVAQGLAGSGIVCPPPGRALLWQTLDSGVAAGLLPPPPAAGLPLAR
jgi:nonribosomal peptide synthetase MxcG